MSKTNSPSVPSPCISVCAMDASSALCKGCWRSIEEIAAWSGISDAEKLKVWSRIKSRIRQAGGEPLPQTPPEAE